MKEQIKESYCIAILDSGNYAMHLIRIFEKKGIYLDFTSIPCNIGWNGCSYCIKFPLEYMDAIIKEGEKKNMPVRAIYSVYPGFMKNKYTKIYENVGQKQR